MSIGPGLGDFTVVTMAENSVNWSFAEHRWWEWKTLAADDGNGEGPPVPAAL